MCIYLRKRFPSLSITGSTISETEVDNSSTTAQMNGVQIPFYVSDVLAGFKGEPVEMIWWNLPYYDHRMLDWLRRLFAQVREKKALVDKGLLVLATNTVPLRAETIVAVAEGFDHLRLVEDKRHSWNPHAVLTFEYLERT
jgi:methylase of polypeptide subunit release factors